MKEATKDMSIYLNVASFKNFNHTLVEKNEQECLGGNYSDNYQGTISEKEKLYKINGYKL